jgi:hypothetical protein
MNSVIFLRDGETGFLIEGLGIQSRSAVPEKFGNTDSG